MSYQETHVLPTLTTGEIGLPISTFGLQVGDEKIIVAACGGNNKDRPGSPRIHLQQTDYLECPIAGNPRTAPPTPGD